MKNRRTDTVTRVGGNAEVSSACSTPTLRVDVRIPNELYDQIQKIAIAHFHAKIHHRSNKPEVTPTILELIKIGIAHLDSESTKQATDETEDDDLIEWIEQLDSRLTVVENKLSSVKVTETVEESSITDEETGLNDLELSKVLGVSNILIRDYRIYGKKPGGQALAKALTEQWAISEGLWFRKKSR